MICSLWPKFLLFLVLISSTLAQAGSADWAFVWVNSAQNKFYVVEGTAKISIANGHLSAELTDKEGVRHYRVVGTFSGKNLKATFTNLSSDFFENSPLVGTLEKAKSSGDPGSKGREMISLSDGWNFLGLTHELP